MNPKLVTVAPFGCTHTLCTGLLYYEEHQSWLADTSEEELSCAVTPKKVIVHTLLVQAPDQWEV